MSTSHTAATALHKVRALFDAGIALTEKGLKSLQERVHEFGRVNSHKLRHEAEALDEKANCPFCGRIATRTTLKELKTYCWRCSNWGHDPRFNSPDETDGDPELMRQLRLRWPEGGQPPQSWLAIYDVASHVTASSTPSPETIGLAADAFTHEFFFLQKGGDKTFPYASDGSNVAWHTVEDRSRKADERQQG